MSQCLACCGGCSTTGSDADSSLNPLGRIGTLSQALAHDQPDNFRCTADTLVALLAKVLAQADAARLASIAQDLA